jgi:lipid II:glycine glycyltransferase (peptidoglycan interpeptide bridge formation enzyme)
MERLKCSIIRIRTSPGFNDARCFLWNGYVVQPHYTYRINLSSGSQAVWENFDRKLRVSIHRAEKEGIEVKRGGREDIEFITGSLSKRFADQGYEPRDHRNYLYDLYDAFAHDHFRIFIAMHQGYQVGGMIAICNRDLMQLWVGVPKPDLKGISPNDLVQWEAIKWACDQGFKYYELMDAGDNPRLRHFKSKYNPEIHIWFSATKYASRFYHVLDILRRTPG